MKKCNYPHNESDHLLQQHFGLWFLFMSFLISMFMNSYTVYAQDPVVVFSEDFDKATNAQAWPYRSFGWWSTSTIYLTSVPEHGKVLHVLFPKGTVAGQSGLGEYKIPLDSSYREIYFSWDYFLQSGFDWGDSDNHAGGKFFGGLSGGKNLIIPHNTNDSTDGWGSMNVWENGYFHTYNYFKNNKWYYFGTNSAWPWGENLTTTPIGVWKNITLRMRMNDPYKTNGIYEVFSDSVLVYSLDSVQYNNSLHPDYLIEFIYLNLFWGGGSDPLYASPKSQYMRFDNLIAYYYPSISEDYRSGTSESGRKIRIPKGSSYHPVPPNIFKETKYTEASGTIESHCGFYLPVANTSNFQTATIEVNGATSINLDLTKFVHDDGVTSSGYKQILKLYEGTGSGKVLKKSFERDVYTPIPSTTTISGNSATIEWQAGAGQHNGFTLTYTSDGIGSGTNFRCGNYMATQGGLGPDHIYELRVTTVGKGSVTPGSGIYRDDTLVELAATAYPAWEFAGWTGDTVSTESILSVNVNSDKRFVANFRYAVPADAIAKINFTATNYNEAGWTNVYGSESFPLALNNGVVVSSGGGVLRPNTTGEPETVFPQNVGRTYNFIRNDDNTPVVFTVSGLDLSSYYAVDFFSSKALPSNGDERKVFFTIGDKTLHVSAVGNKDSVLTIAGVKPTSLGEMPITISKPNGYSANLNALIIRKSGLVNSGNDILMSGIRYYPVPVKDKLFLNNLPLNSLISVYTISGIKLYDVENGNETDIQIEMSNYYSGVFVVKVTDLSTKKTMNFKVIKE